VSEDVLEADWATVAGAGEGGRVYGRWPGLSTANLYQERDLAITTDFRDPIATVLRSHMQVHRRADRSSNYPDARAPAATSMD